MKTTTIISALSFALIFTAANAGFAKPIGKPGNHGANPTVRVKYLVTVNIDISKPLCDNYLVEILDASGRQVAPAQMYVPGQEIYSFDEQTRQTAGIRIAHLKMIPRGGPEHFVCEQELFAQPAVRLINFADRKVYSFDLYAAFRQPK
jgi:hypothetical protein